ncbi:glutamate-rich WD repeat-containing protein 1-like [Cyanistes caeruleus]|uniref:glutamate-rich WD repeat-containing protein 1-like n=1 Tax=Cyanistes caeruleus TaxID=156563 RepID=UPI000CDA24E8|nr:glutamate-rich WD repeat-containing protein 1-like [Cyanistes caeruleus]
MRRMRRMRKSGSRSCCSSWPPNYTGNNRLRVTSLGGSPVAAVWSERGQVEVLELGRALAVLEGQFGEGDSRRGQRSVQQGALPELASFSGHLDEGFALDWSPQSPGEGRGKMAASVRGKGGKCEETKWRPA